MLLSCAQRPLATTSPVVRDEEAAGSNPVTPTVFPQVRRPHQKWWGPLCCQYSSKTRQVQQRQRDL